MHNTKTNYMKKSFVMILAAVLVFAACQAEKITETAVDDGEALVSISLYSPDATIAARSLASGANSAKGGFSNVSLTDYSIRYQLAVYRVEDDALTQLGDPQVVSLSETGAASFTLGLTPGYTYKFVAFADFVTAGSTSDLHYNTTDLTNITILDSSDAQLNDESRDAYFVSYEQAVESSLSLNLALTRPFAKLRLVTTDYDDSTVTAPDAVSISYYGCTRFSSLNAVTGEVTGETLADSGNTTYTGTLASDKEYSDGLDAEDAYRTLLVDYLLADSDEQSVLHFTFASSVNSVEIYSVDVSTNVPIQRNYLTTVSGELLSGGNVILDVSVEISDDFSGESDESTGGEDEEDDTVEVPTTISSADDLVLFLSYVDSTYTGTYTLGDDIDMSGVTLEAGVTNFCGTFEGSNHLIKNLVSSVPLFESIGTSGVVQNLILDGTCSFTPSDLVFGPIAKVNYGTISGVTNNAAVSYTYDPSTVEDLALIAGIAGESYGPITTCTNNGAISVTSESSVKGGVAGITAHLVSDMTGSVNNGTVTQTAQLAGYTSTYPSGTSKSCYPAVGGLVAYSASGFSMTSCTNNGTVTMNHYAIDSAEKSERMCIGGVVGDATGAVTGCVNNGSVNVSTITTTRDSLSTSYMLCVGGVAGGDFTGSNTSSYIGCVNNGTVTVDSDAYGSYSRMAGVVGFPGAESGTGHAVTGCNDTGEFIYKGYGKAYIGGIAGGSSTLSGCSATGKITIDGAQYATEVGGLIGYHNTQSLDSYTVDVEMSVACKLTGIGGVMGRCANSAQTLSGGSTVKAVITSTSESNSTLNTGLVVGDWVGTSKVVTIGSESSPLTVSGSVLGTELTSDNYSSYLSGTKYYSESNKVIYASLASSTE